MNVKRVGHSLAYSDGFIYAVGGKSNASVCTKLVERYDLETNTWTLLAPMLYGRSRPGLVLFSKDTLFAFFGSDSLGIVHSTIEIYSINNNQWKLLQLDFPLKRLQTNGLSCCQINS
jgi:hypothetical protein